jgi:hypothetical protein
MQLLTLELKLEALVRRWSGGIGRISRVRRGGRRSAGSGYMTTGLTYLGVQDLTPDEKLKHIRNFDPTYRGE